MAAGRAHAGHPDHRRGRLRRRRRGGDRGPRKRRRRPAEGRGQEARRHATGGDGKAPKRLWTKTTSAETYGDNDELVVAAGVVLASGSPLAALDAATGKRKWSLPCGAVPGASLLLGKDTLYLASSRYDGTVTGYDPASGKEP